MVADNILQVQEQVRGYRPVNGSKAGNEDGVHFTLMRVGAGIYKLCTQATTNSFGLSELLNKIAKWRLRFGWMTV